jgi:hypothetical protein
MAHHCSRIVLSRIVTTRSLAGPDVFAARAGAWYNCGITATSFYFFNLLFHFRIGSGAKEFNCLFALHCLGV